MADRDVRLIIRAKNEATKEIKSVSDAMNVLAKETSAAAKDLKQPIGVMAQLGQEFKRLNSQIKVSEALAKVGDYTSKAANGIADLKGELAGLKSAFDKSASAQAGFESRTNELRSELDALRKTQQTQRADQKSAIAMTNKESDAKRNLTAANKELRAAQALSEKNADRGARIDTATANVQAAQAAFDAYSAAADETRAKVAATAAQIDNLEISLKESEKAFRGAEAEGNRLASTMETVAGQIQRGEAAFAEITTATQEFKTAIGSADTETSQLVAQAKAAVPQVERLGNALAAMQRFSRGDGTYGDPKTAANLQRQTAEIDKALQAWKDLEYATQQAALAMKATDQPTRAQVAAFEELIRASRAAKEEWRSQVAALAELKTGVNEVKVAMDRYADGMGGQADAKVAASLRQQASLVTAARDRWQLLAAEVTRLNGVYAAHGGEQVAAELRATAQAANLAEKEFREAAAALKSLENAGKSGGSFFGSINSEGRTTLSLYQRLRGEVLALTAAYVGFYGAIQNVGGVISAYQTLEAAQNRLGSVFNQDTGRVANELGFIERQAKRLGIEFGTLSDQYSKFAVSAQAANISNEDTRKIFLSVAEAVRVNKLSLEDMNGIFLALTQMIQKGRVSSEELRQQLGERLLGAVNIFADALGVTTAELSKMLEQGEVLADSSTMLKFADELSKRFGPQLAAALQSTSTEIGKFGNNAYDAQLQFAKGGFIESFTEALRGLNKWFQSEDGMNFFLGLGAAAGKVVDVLALIPPNIGLITAVVQALIATKLAGWFMGVINGVSGLSKAQVAMIASNKALEASIAGLNATLAPATAQTVALGNATTVTATKMTLAGAASTAMATGVGVLRGAMALAATAARTLWAAIGGWAGVIVSAVAYLASDLIGSWLTQVDDVTQTLAEHEALMGRILTAYDEAAGKTDRWGEALAKFKLDEIENMSRNLQTQLDAVNDKIRTISDGASLKDVTTAWRGLFGGWDDIIVKAEQLARSYKKGESSVKDYVAGLEKLYGTLNDDAAKEFVAELLKTAREADNLTTALERTKDAADKKKIALTELRGTLSDIKSPLEQMVDATKASADALDQGKEAADRYKTALDGIKSFIPGLAAELKKMKDLAKLDEFVDQLGFGPRTQQQQQYIDDARKSILSEADQATFKEIAGNTKVTSQLFSDIFKEESFRSKAYNDGYGTPTIGYGSTRMDGRAVQYGDEITKERGMQLAIADLDKLIAQIQAMVKVSLSDNQLRALVSYSYNAGIGSLKRDGILAPLNAGDYKGAENAIRNGVDTSKGVYSQGLRDRRVREANLFASGADDPAVIRQTVELEEKRTEEIKKGNEATQKRLADGQAELEQQNLKNAGKEREAAMIQAEREARAENKNITDAEVAKVRELAAARYDAANALSKDEESKKKAKELDEQINALETQRNAILAQRKIYEEAGDKEGMLKTDAELAGVNQKLQEAIDKSIAFHQALGGEKAAATVAQLNATKLAIANANTEGQKFAMTASQMSDSIYSTLESGIINMFDTFAQAIANGENAVDALWTAFRQFAADFLLQIAQMIIKQTLFNSLQSFSKSLGGGLFSFLSMHSGGVVGASGVGSGSRSISPAWFTNAVRYHTGGMVGLAPDEVPIVARQGEEVLTETDPRHRNNGGLGGGGGNTKVVNMFDAPSFLSEALNSKVGEEAIFNFVRANPAAFKQALNG